VDVTVIWSLMIADWLARMGLLMYRYQTKNWQTQFLPTDPDSEFDSSLAPVKSA